MEQRTSDWYEWRSQGIGSSDIAAIIGVSPYMTPYGLWRIKVGLDEQVADNFATYRGRKFEDKARACFELESDKDYEPKLFQSEQYPFLRASLDGWNAEEREILEIKCPGKATLDLAKEGKLPEHYMAQVQYQLYVANGRSALYYAFEPESEKGYSIRIEPDYPYILSMVKKAKKFWMMVQNKTEPEMTDRDFAPLTPDFEGLIDMYRFHRKMKQLDQEREVRAMILSKMTHPRMKGYGVTIYPSSTGRVAIRFQKEKADEASI